MTESTPSPQDPSDQQGSSINPETAFHALKILQNLGFETLAHTDPTLIGERNDGGHDTLIFYSSVNKCFGTLDDWDGAFFSFTEKNFVTQNDDDSSIWLERNPPNQPPYPQGGILSLRFNLGGVVEVGEVLHREALFLSEGPPIVQDWTMSEPGTSPLQSVWRVMTEQEGQDLLADTAELTNRLHNYLQDNQGPLFSDADED